MTDTPNSDRKAQEVLIAWPIDTYVGGKTVNQFVFNVADGIVQFAFGHVPVVPDTPIPLPEQMPIPVVGNYTFDPSMLASLRQVLNAFAAAHPEYFPDNGDEPSSETDSQ